MNKRSGSKGKEKRIVNKNLKSVHREQDKEAVEPHRMHSNIESLLDATEVGIILVDHELNVRRFTSTSAEIFDFKPSDIGRPLENVSHYLHYDALLDDINQVLSNRKKIEKVVCGENNSWFIMRLTSYHSTKNEVDGVAITFTEFTELKEARETLQEQSRQESLASLGMYALEKDDLELVMERAIDLSCIVLDLDCAIILSLDEEGGHFKMRQHAGCANKIKPLVIEEKWDVGFTLKNNKPTIVTDYSKDDRFSISPYTKDQDFKSSVNVVIRGAENTYGIFGFYSKKKDDFTENDANYIQVVANIIGRAMERDKVRETLRKKNQQLKKEMARTREYQKEIINNNITERWDLGGYLHDNLAQTLASAKMLAFDIEKKLTGNTADVEDELAGIKKIIDQGVEDIRNLTKEIIPVDIENGSVEHAFRSLMQQTEKIYDTNCTLQADEIVNEIEDLELATHLYHIVQEAVKNAIVHGSSENITVEMKKNGGKLKLKIKDDGVGLSSSPKEDPGKGISIMKHRVELFGGTFSIEELGEGKAKGTCVIAEIPLSRIMGKDKENINLSPQ